MKAIEYTTNISTNGIFSLPKKFLQELNINKNSKVKILLLYEDEPVKKRLAKFCGEWQDERNAHDILKEIYSDRDKNTRSERTEL